jgi:hypothetical protein
VNEITNNIPTEADWRSEPWDLDIPYAYKNFAGKSHEQAVALFQQNALCYQEDVMFMPRACFLFYIHAYIDYLLSDVSRGDADGANCFFSLVESRANDIRGNAAVHSTVERVLRHLATRQEWYDADPAIYGDFGERAVADLQRLRR